jgi:hypothetical protein
MQRASISLVCSSCPPRCNVVPLVCRDCQASSKAPLRMLIASGSNADVSGRLGNGKVATDALPKGRRERYRTLSHRRLGCGAAVGDECSLRYRSAFSPQPLTAFVRRPSGHRLLHRKPEDERVNLMRWAATNQCNATKRALGRSTTKDLIGPHLLHRYP